MYCIAVWMPELCTVVGETPPAFLREAGGRAHACWVVSLSVVSRGTHRTVLQADLSAASLQNSVCPTGRTVLADVNVATGCARCPRSVPSEQVDATAHGLLTKAIVVQMKKAEEHSCFA